MAHVYILESERDKRYYIGSTAVLDTRLKHHFGVLKLVFSQYFHSLKEARLIERKLKKLKRKDYLRKIIQDGYIKMRP